MIKVKRRDVVIEHTDSSSDILLFDSLSLFHSIFSASEVELK